MGRFDVLTNIAEAVTAIGTALNKAELDELLGVLSSKKLNFSDVFKGLDPSAAATILKNSDPSVPVAILKNLDPDHAKAVFKQLDDIDPSKAKKAFELTGDAAIQKNLLTGLDLVKQKSLVESLNDVAKVNLRNALGEVEFKKIAGIDFGTVAIAMKNMDEVDQVSFLKNFKAAEQGKLLNKMDDVDVSNILKRMDPTDAADLINAGTIQPKKLGKALDGMTKDEVIALAKKADVKQMSKGLNKMDISPNYLKDDILKSLDDVDLTKAYNKELTSRANRIKNFVKDTQSCQQQY